MSNNSQTAQYFVEMRIPIKRPWSVVVSTPANVDALFSLLLECFPLTRRKERGKISGYPGYLMQQMTFLLRMHVILEIPYHLIKMGKR